MKKLVSIFAALAMVGALAAQKRKAPAKKAAAPAPVAAPAAPAAVTAPAPVVAAPAASGKGLGLFVDVRGTYTLSNGSSTSAADGSSATTVAADQVSYKTSASAAIGGGLSIGYNLAAGLGLVASYDIRSFKTREYTGRASDYLDMTAGNSSHDAVAGATQAKLTTGTAQQTWTNQVIGLGLRPQVSAFGGEFFGGAGLAIVLPFETTQKLSLSSSNATFNATTGNATSAEIVKGYNIAFGAYGEVGYKYFFTDMIGLNIGIRALVATTDNNGKTKVQTTNGTGNAVGLSTVTTTSYKDSYSDSDKTALPAQTAASASKIASFETLGITDFSANIGVSLKF